MKIGSYGLLCVPLLVGGWILSGCFDFQTTTTTDGGVDSETEVDTTEDTQEDSDDCPGEDCTDCAGDTCPADSADGTDDDTETDTGECTAGPCCDTKTNSFEPLSDTPCDIVMEYRCSDSGCGARQEYKESKHYCSGNSASCDGRVVEGQWLSNTCLDSQECNMGEDGQAKCETTLRCECTSSGNYYDGLDKLCWQNPPSSSGMLLTVTKNYCWNLKQGGYTDWDLPNIDQLLSLMMNCLNGGVHFDGWQPSECSLSPYRCEDDGYCESVGNCDPCTVGNGPGEGGCFWLQEMSGKCDSYWSSTEGGDGAWLADFARGTLLTLHETNMGYVRCIRQGK